MNVEIPDNCECTDDEVCNHCIWNTACAIVELNDQFNKLAKEDVETPLQIEEVGNN